MNKAKIDNLIEELLLMCDKFTNNNGARFVDDMYPILPFFHNLYPATNEELYEFFPKLNLKNSSVMTVGSSGDQVLYSLMFGAKEVVCVDINPFTKFFYDLKVAGIKHFDFTNFNKYFGFYQQSEDTFSAEVYRQISHLLPEDSKYFWDNIFLEVGEVSNFLQYSRSTKSHYTFDEKQYNKLKEIVENPAPVKFKCGDIRNISKNLGDKKYDVIVLSNIYDYIDDWRVRHKREDSVLMSNDWFSPQQKEYFATCKRFFNALNPNGFLQVQHSWDKTALICTGGIFEELFDKFKVMEIETSMGGGPIIVQNTLLEKESMLHEDVLER